MMILIDYQLILPVTSHLVARKLKKWNVPWIADLHDLWTQNHFYSYSRFRKKIDLKLEKKLARLMRSQRYHLLCRRQQIHDTPVLLGS